MDQPHQLMPDIVILSSCFPIPGAGFLAVNAFVIQAAEPVLVDTGMGIESPAFMEALASVIDPRDLKWVWLTHDDADHTGSLRQVLDAAPGARLVANSLAVLRMSTAWPVPMHRVRWLNPGDCLDVGDRKLTAVRTPLFDNPTTIGLFDHKSEAFFSADCFGAILPAPVPDADDAAEETLSQGMIAWASGDNPWVHMVEPRGFGRALARIRQLAPKAIFSGHLPPAWGRTDEFLEWLAAVPASTPFVPPDQAALEQLLAQAGGGPAVT
jgi:glyoxylase-like metal-dependent hydrolase (beta-lactamase superfamily II)